MPVSRRDVLRAAVVIPTGAAAVVLAARAADGLRAAAAVLRPEPDGTSATRCAACGGRGHTMLDPRCPAARKVI
jgi:hypothetical protein